MKKVVPILILLFAIGAIATGVIYFNTKSNALLSPISLVEKVTEKPLDKYTLTRLTETTFNSQPINTTEVLAEETNYTSFLISFGANGKTVTGQMNVPTTPPPLSGFPVIIMLRGYVDPDVYETGMGTKNAAAVFAANGFITLAPDFLGFGGSADPDPNSIAARLERPATVLTLLASINTLPEANANQLFLWGHSNGGQIAFSVLEIIGNSPHWQGKIIPTTLWAPVSKSFPYSILYYTDESEDQGKELRRVLAEFEKSYDTNNYSIDRYYDWITSPIQIHQGSADDAVPVEWSNELVSVLEERDKDVTYYTYPGADHNLRPAWDRVVARDLTFFRQFLKTSE